MSGPGPDDVGPAWSDWLVSLILGVTTGFGVLATGIIGIGLAVLALALIAWKGSRVLAIGGYLCGFAALWAVLMWNVVARCNAENQQAGTTCVSGATSAYLVASVIVLLVGVAITIVGARRSSDRPH